MRFLEHISEKWFCHTLLFLLRKQIFQTLMLLKLANSKGFTSSSPTNILDWPPFKIHAKEKFNLAGDHKHYYYLWLGWHQHHQFQKFANAVKMSGNSSSKNPSSFSLLFCLLTSKEWVETFFHTTAFRSVFSLTPFLPNGRRANGIKYSKEERESKSFKEEKCQCGNSVSPSNSGSNIGLLSSYPTEVFPQQQLPLGTPWSRGKFQLRYFDRI